MSLLEAAVRGGVIALILVLAALAARAARRAAVERYGALFALCAVAYLIESAPALTRSQAPWIEAVRLVSISTPAVFWLWIKAQIDDPFVPAWRNWLPWLGLVGLGLWAMASDTWLAWHAVKYASLALVGLGIWQTLAGRGGDLVEGRRRLRLILATAAACYIIVIEFLAFATEGRGGGLVATIALDVALGAYAAVAIYARLTHTPIVATVAEPVVAAPPRPAVSLDPEEARLLEALRQAMEVDRAYREEDCSIAALAARLGIPEYRLRRLINQRLGHRNFASYVNGYRLAEAVAALADPSQERVPILTIALDAGFQSLGPFNRAFKVHTGMTPSEFRRDRLAAAAPATPIDAPPATPLADFGNRPAAAKIG